MLSVFYLLPFYLEFPQKRIEKKEMLLEKNEILAIIILLIIEIFFLYIFFYISKIFNFSFLRNITSNKLSIGTTIIFSILFTSFAVICFKAMSSIGLHFFNMLIFSLILADSCLQIARSQKFINWIGENLDKNLRNLIMFFIFLNILYFFSAISYGIISSLNLFTH